MWLSLFFFCSSSHAKNSVDGATHDAKTETADARWPIRTLGWCWISHVSIDPMWRFPFKTISLLTSSYKVVFPLSVIYISVSYTHLILALGCQIRTDDWKGGGGKKNLYTWTPIFNYQKENSQGLILGALHLTDTRAHLFRRQRW